VRAGSGDCFWGGLLQTGGSPTRAQKGGDGAEREGGEEGGLSAQARVRAGVRAERRASQVGKLATSISRPGGTPGWLWNFWPDSTEPDHHNLNEPLGPADPGPARCRQLKSSAGPRPAPATPDPAGHALHGPSCEPETPHATRMSSSRASSLHEILSRPPACHCQDPAGTRAARTLPWPSDSDWTRSRLHHRATQHELGRT
jgi:hypothetical protein